MIFKLIKIIILSFIQFNLISAYCYYSYDCRNGGTCSYSGTCYCSSGYTGTYCEAKICNNFKLLN